MLQSMQAGKCLVVGTHGAIFSTADSGVSWVQRISGTADELRAIGCLFEDGRLLCLTGGRRAIKTSLSLLITFDSGESWEDVGNQVFSDSDDGDNQGVVLPFMGESFNIWDMSILKGTGVGYACGNELFKTEDSGSTWMRLNFLESPFASICYSVLVLSEDVVYAMSEDAIHLSEDGGSSWETLSYQCGTGFQLACPQVGMQISSSQATLLFGDGDFTTLSTMTVTYVLSEAYYTAEKQIVYNYDPPQPSGKRRSLQQTQSDLTFNAILMGDQLVDVANRESGAFPNLVLRAQVKVSTAQEPDSAPAGSMAPLLRFYNGDLLLSTDVTGSISAIYLDPAFYIPAGDAEFDKIIFEFASDDDILLTSGTQPYTYPYGATLDSNGLFTWDLTMTNLIMPSLNCTTYFHVNVLLKNSAGDVASSVAFTLALQSYANAAGEMLYRDAETATFNQQETSPALT
eukprot:gene1588-2223_t